MEPPSNFPSIRFDALSTKENQVIMEPNTFKATWNSTNLSGFSVLKNGEVIGHVHTWNFVAAPGYKRSSIAKKVSHLFLKKVTNQKRRLLKIGETRVENTSTIYYPDKETVAPGKNSNQGNRIDLTAVTDAIKSGHTVREIAAEHPETFIKFHRGIAQLHGLMRAPVRSLGVQLLPWQHTLLGKLTAPAHPRKIIWLIDDLGNSGKTYFAKLLASNYSALIFSGGKNDRIQHQYEGEKLVVFDFPRAVQSQDKDFVPYASIEAIKNGFTARMYGERTLFARETPHVVCFSNFNPDISKFSQDRWDMTYLGPADQFDQNNLTPLVTPADPVTNEIIPDQFSEIPDDLSSEEELVRPPLKRTGALIISSDEELNMSDSDEEFLRKVSANQERDKRRNLLKGNK